MDTLKIITMVNGADDRGDKYFIPVEAFDFIGEIKEMHFVSILPGAIRGNHFHEDAKELVILRYSHNWQCVWSDENCKQAIVRKISGDGTVAVLIPPGIPHTFVNSGAKPILLYCFSDRRHDPENPHTFPEELVA